MNSSLAFVLWCSLQWLLGVTAWWTGHHVGMRLATSRCVFADAHCDRCAHPLEWRQLPILGRYFGCEQCGHRGPAYATACEITAGLILVATAVLTDPRLAPILFVALTVIATAAGAAQCRILRRHLRPKQHLTNDENN